jgi:hypothetical protein
MVVTAASCVGASGVECGPPTPLVASAGVPDLYGAPLGPLLIRGAYNGIKDARIAGFVRGDPTKVLAIVNRDMENDIELVGVRCADAQPLRFWMNKTGLPWFSGATPLPEAEIATKGDARALLPKAKARTNGTFAYGGYMLFPTTGTYRVEALDGERAIGAVTILVTDEPLAP